MYNEKSIDKFKINTLIFINVLCITAIFYLCWNGYYNKLLDVRFSFKGNSLLLSMFGGCYFLYFLLYEAHKISISSVSELIYDQFLSLMLTDLIAYFVIVLILRDLQNVIPMLLCFVAQCFVSALWSFLIHRWYFATHKPKRTVVIWDVSKGLRELINMYGLEKRYQVIDNLYVKDCIKELPKYLDGMEAVFLSGVHSGDRNKVIKYCVRNNIDAYVIPRIGDTIMRGAKPLHLFNLPMLKVVSYSPRMSYLFIKRAVDIIISGIALIILLPLMIITAVAIKATDGGSVLYKQCRLTQGGKKFNILKFRSMRMDAEKDGVARLSTGSADDRITPVGRFIRAVRIDELPQLINILKGEMSIVGPRPERPEIAAEYEKEMPEFALRLQAKAGLTGYAQVYGRYNTTPYDKLLLDLNYIANPGIAEDFKIFMATIKILFMPESTEGVAVGQITALQKETAADHDSEKQNVQMTDGR